MLMNTLTIRVWVLQKVRTKGELWGSCWSGAVATSPPRSWCCVGTTPGPAALSRRPSNPNCCQTCFEHIPISCDSTYSKSLGIICYFCSSDHQADFQLCGCVRVKVLLLQGSCHTCLLSFLNSSKMPKPHEFFTKEFSLMTVSSKQFPHIDFFQNKAICIVKSKKK